MNILAIDTAMGAASACVWCSDDSTLICRETLHLNRGHGEAVLPLVERVISRFAGGFDSLQRIAVTIGPGSFTGLRIGISAARGFGLALNIPVVGVSTLAALAAPWLADLNGSLIVSAVDAKHGKVYMAAYASHGRALLSPRLLEVTEAIRLLGSGTMRLTGSGAPLLANEARNRGMPSEILGDVIAPDIIYVAKLGVLADPNTAIARPLYLKSPNVTAPTGSEMRPNQEVINPQIQNSDEPFL